MKKKILVITGSRADYGLLRWLMFFFKKDNSINFKLIITGSHLSKNYGYTVKDIIKDGFNENTKININLGVGDQLNVAESIGIGIQKISKSINKINPHIVVLLGDRFEILASAISALILKVPVAHIHGGELTYGAFDDAIRHSVTKMSNLHFVSSLVYKKRVEQLGENPKTVFNVGGLGLDNIKYLKLLNKKKLEKALKTNLYPHNILVTFHPVTLNKVSSILQLKNLLDAMEKFKKIKFFITGPNSDPVGRDMKNIIQSYVKKNLNFVFYESLGQLRYLSCLKHFDAVMGNSSSGIIEAPALNILTINIGNRQKGRLMSKSIINCKPNKKKIINIINNLLKGSYKKKLKNNKPMYGKPGASKKIYNILKKINFIKTTEKNFYDIK